MDGAIEFVFLEHQIDKQSLAEYWKNLDLYAFLFILIYISVIFIVFCGIYLENID